ncbi:MAG: hypothetical protein CVT89_00020 [Candidatus Altiarchaeales archaeon HGW-Altiarchaeales-2]|nr:MAG: hypothetical protein CVT89_00020 [Candidatus Altiarchaeales archaeon HGW-Altiarchaeales-2]
MDKDVGRDIIINNTGDLETVSGAFNLGQAITNRLMTRKGELSELGHANYGSRMYELIGEPNNERTRELAKIYVKECLSQEPRIKEIVKVVVSPVGNDRIDISISAIPIESEVVLNIVFPFYLEIV